MKSRYHGDCELEQKHKVLSQGFEARGEINVSQLVQFRLEFRVRHEHVHEMGGDPYQARRVDRKDGVGIELMPHGRNDGTCETLPDEEACVLVRVPPCKVDTVVHAKLSTTPLIVVVQLKRNGEREKMSKGNSSLVNSGLTFNIKTQS